MKKIIFITIIVILVALTITFLTSDFYKNNNQKTKEVCFKENCYNVEIADTQQERELGLMNREKLDDDKGMLFIFEKAGIYGFWMKNTLIPLDIIWIDGNNKIVDITTMQPCKIEICRTYTPTSNALYVLELNANTSKEINLSIGDKLNFDL